MTELLYVININKPTLAACLQGNCFLNGLPKRECLLSLRNRFRANVVSDGNLIEMVSAMSFPYRVFTRKTNFNSHIDLKKSFVVTLILPCCRTRGNRRKRYEPRYGNPTKRFGENVIWRRNSNSFIASDLK